MLTVMGSDCTRTVVTFVDTSPSSAVMVCVMWAVPGAIAVIVPFASTSATPLLLLLHMPDVPSYPMFMIVPGSRVAIPLELPAE